MITAAIANRACEDTSPCQAFTPEVAELTARIFDLQRCSMHDGPGVRTTVFLKGCPLRCSWCHNPESQRFGEERMEVSDAPGCFETVGRLVSVREVLALVLRDRDYFQTSGGGLTVSGGEPMASPTFTQALLEAAKREGLHTCLDTSGAAPVEAFRRIRHAVDLFLYDVKLFDDDASLRHVGRTAGELLAGLRVVDACGSESVLRCSIIPGLNANTTHFRALADLANELRNITAIHLIPYHSFGNQKRRRLGRSDSFQAAIATPEEVRGWEAMVRALTCVPVGRG